MEIAWHEISAATNHPSFYIAEISFLLDTLRATAAAATQIVEAKISELLTSLMVFLGSPLTALLAQTRLRGFLKSLVPKSVIASRNVLVDLLQVVAANNHGISGQQ